MKQILALAIVVFSTVQAGYKLNHTGDYSRSISTSLCLDPMPALIRIQDLGTANFFANSLDQFLIRFAITGGDLSRIVKLPSSSV